VRERGTKWRDSEAGPMRGLEKFEARKKHEKIFRDKRGKPMGRCGASKRHAKI
jgi:hypothetical protein